VSNANCQFAKPVGHQPGWNQTIDGGPPKQVTNFKSSLGLYNYAPSPDGKQIAVARGNEFNDIVLIKGSW
jgi:hypothetical protein